ncbi:MAG: DUF2752 domain-containing protein [Clostridia bacterium]|nr:DUF2752 domain-containing protein [Clostridia bacterium]
MKKQTGLFWAIVVLLFLGAFKCPLYEVFGVPCPTCGMTRAWRSVLSFDLATAFSMHPLFLLPLLVFVKKAHKKWVLITVCGIFILVYIIRMVFLFPDTVPMNYNYSSLLGGFFLK